MENFSNTTYYDGSFNGFLTVLYDMEQGNVETGALRAMNYTPDALFPEPNYVETRIKDAQILWEQLRIANYSALKTLYFAFMSGEKDIEKSLLHFYREWKKRKAQERNIMYDQEFADLYRLAAEVEKEKREVEYRLRTQTVSDGPIIKYIRPKYNILPLISKYLRNRFRNSEWYVFDLRRKYGLHHLNKNLSMIPFRPEHLKMPQRETASHYLSNSSVLKETNATEPMTAVA